MLWFVVVVLVLAGADLLAVATMGQVLYLKGVTSLQGGDRTAGGLRFANYCTHEYTIGVRMFMQ